MNIVIFNKDGEATIYKNIEPFQNNMDQLIIENSLDISQIVISMNEHLEYFSRDEFLKPDVILETMKRTHAMETYDLITLKYKSLVLEILIKIYDQLL